MAFGLDANGYNAPRSADLLQIIRDRFEAELAAAGLPTDIDWERDTVLGNLTAVISTVLGDLSEGTQSLYDSRDVNAATGTSLHNLGAIVGIEPQEATYSQGYFFLVGTNGTLVAAGKEIETSDVNGTYRWSLLSDTTIGAGPTSALFRAVDIGAVRAEAGTHEIVTPVAGWDSVTSAVAASGGTDAETDQEFRLRRQQSLQVSGSRSMNALLAKLLELDFVTGAVAVDNDSDVAQTDVGAVLIGLLLVGGMDVDAHGIAIGVLPAVLTAAQKIEVAEVIYQHLAAGIATTGDGSNVVDVTAIDGFTKRIEFYTGAETPLSVDITITYASGYSLLDVQDAVTDAVNDYFDTLEMGDDVRRLPVLAALDAIRGIDSAVVKYNGVDDDWDTPILWKMVVGPLTVV